MKQIIILGLLLTSSNVFASKFADIKEMSNPRLESARQEIESLEFSPFASLKKVTVLKAKGSTPQLQREATVAQAMHGLCRFFDDGVAVGIDTKDEAGSLAAMEVFADQMEHDSSDYQKLLKAIKTVNAESGVELYSGDASGNNTYGTVLGFYDTKTNEIAVFANTNCGSDN